MRKFDRIPKAAFAILAVVSFSFTMIRTNELNAQNREMIQLARTLKATCR